MSNYLNPQYYNNCALVVLYSWFSTAHVFGFVGIVYSFGIEMRPQGLNCSLELPEEEIIPTSEENFAALRVILDRVQQAVVPAK